MAIIFRQVRRRTRPGTATGRQNTFGETASGPDRTREPTAVTDEILDEMRWRFT